MPTNNGYIEKVKGDYVGNLSIEGIDISPISAMFFKDSGTHWLWIKRKKILEYSFETNSYSSKTPLPFFEAYLSKQSYDKNKIAYRGTFIFMRFRYVVYCIWDEKHKENDRLNIYVERLTNDKQDIIMRTKQIINNGE